jgi:hypothetical protein
MILYAPTEQDFDDLFSLDDAFLRSEAINAGVEVADDERDPWQMIQVDCGDGSDWVDAHPITMADLAIMCGDAP